MVWGKFDEHLAGIFPAMLLRTQVRRRGIASASDEYKALVLEPFIDELISTPKIETSAAPIRPRAS